MLGLGIGLGQGLADRSRERLVYGLIGGGLGGFAGGFLFEWLRSTFSDRTDMSQAVGIVLLGAGLGLCLALVEQVLRRAWVQVQSGRQEGRIYLLAHPRCRLGLDERAEIGIFGDPAVARQHAEIESTPRGYVLRHLAGQGNTRVNGGAVAARAAACKMGTGSSWDIRSWSSGIAEITKRKDGTRHEPSPDKSGTPAARSNGPLAARNRARARCRPRVCP